MDYDRLVASISRGVADGNAALISQLVNRSDANHDLRGIVQVNIDKTYALDAEVKLLKGMIFSLLGNGDGSTGMVPGIQRNVTDMGGEVAGLKADIGQVKRDISGLDAKIDKMLIAQSEQKSWTDGWKGVAVALGILGTCITIMGTLIAALVWLYTHVQHGALSAL